jgi:hypothetical protein
VNKPSSGAKTRHLGETSKTRHRQRFLPEWWITSHRLSRRSIADPSENDFPKLRTSATVAQFIFDRGRGFSFSAIAAGRPFQHFFHLLLSQFLSIDGRPLEIGPLLVILIVDILL